MFLALAGKEASPYGEVWRGLPLSSSPPWSGASEPPSASSEPTATSTRPIASATSSAAGHRLPKTTRSGTSRTSAFGLASEAYSGSRKRIGPASSAQWQGRNAARSSTKRLLTKVTNFTKTSKMKPETKNKWSVVINIVLTTITAILSAFGLA